MFNNKPIYLFTSDKSFFFKKNKWFSSKIKFNYNLKLKRRLVQLCGEQTRFKVVII